MWIFAIIKVLHVIISVLLIGVILLQAGKGGGMGVAFGGVGSQNMFSAHTTANFLTRITTIIAAIFMLSSLSLAWASSRTDSSRLKKASKPTISEVITEQVVQDATSEGDATDSTSTAPSQEQPKAGTPAQKPAVMAPPKDDMAAPVDKNPAEPTKPAAPVMTAPAGGNQRKNEADMLPASRPVAPMTRPAAPMTRPAAPMTQPAAPMTRPAAPMTRPGTMPAPMSSMN